MRGFQLGVLRLDTYSSDARGSCPRNRTRTWGIYAPPPSCCGIRADGDSGGSWIEAAWSGGLLCWRRLRSGHRRNDGGHHGLDEHAIAHGAIEVALASDAAIVLPRLVLELDAYPVAHLEVGLAKEADNALAAIGELHRLTGFEIGHYAKLWG